MQINDFLKCNDIFPIISDDVVNSYRHSNWTNIINTILQISSILGASSNHITALPFLLYESGGVIENVEDIKPQSQFDCSTTKCLEKQMGFLFAELLHRVDDITEREKIANIILSILQQLDTKNNTNGGVSIHLCIVFLRNLTLPIFSQNQSWLFSKIGKRILQFSLLRTNDYIIESMIHLSEKTGGDNLQGLIGD